MARVYILFLLFPFASCGQINQEFKLQNSFPINLKTPVCISKDDCFCFSSDSSLFYLIMNYSDAKCEKKKLVDSVEFSSYKSMVHGFKSQKDNSYVVLWETEYEYYPEVFAYYVVGKSIIKVGELPISLPCQTCESFEFPVQDVQIIQDKDELEISFLKDVNQRNSGNNEWKLYKAGLLKYRFNTETRKLQTITID